MLFWGTPIIYVIETAPNAVREILMMNPLAVVIEQARHAVVDPSAPGAAAASGSAARLLIPVAIVALLLAISIGLYRRMAPTIAERL
jgi:ABC-2 type transport system permease protein